MERKRKMGYQRCEIRESLLENAGQGLYARKKIKENEIICSYEGTEISKDQLDNTPISTRDYVALAFFKSGIAELKFIDSRERDDCYGRYANDPLDDLLVNAKILWKDNRMVLVAMVDIEEGDEIYVSYAKDYWYSRMDKLPELLKKRIRRRYPGEKVVTFREDAEEVMIDGRTKRLPAKKGMIARSIITKPPAKNLMTRLKEKTLEETRRALIDNEEEEQKEADVNTFKSEDYIHENVNQCEDLADQLRLILEGRKYIDNENGKLYEVSRIRYDEEYGMVIGFRKPLHGTRDAEDDCAYVVYGKDGLYELTEKYLLDHPEDRLSVEWPKSNGEWADRQLEDETLRDIINDLRADPIKEIVTPQGHYTFMDIEEGLEDMLVLKQMGKIGWQKK